MVDDEADIRGLITLNLHREGFGTIEAPDGLEAFRIARKSSPDLVILDLMMPHMDGITVFQKMRNDSRTNRIPVLMLTARGKLEEKINGLELGADDYVTKPFSPKELMLRVRNLLRRTLSASGTDAVEIGDLGHGKHEAKQDFLESEQAKKEQYREEPQTSCVRSTGSHRIRKWYR